MGAILGARLDKSGPAAHLVTMERDRVLCEIPRKPYAPTTRRAWTPRQMARLNAALERWAAKEAGRCACGARLPMADKDPGEAHVTDCLSLALAAAAKDRA